MLSRLAIVFAVTAIVTAHSSTCLGQDGVRTETIQAPAKPDSPPEDFDQRRHEYFVFRCRIAVLSLKCESLLIEASNYKVPELIESLESRATDEFPAHKIDEFVIQRFSDRADALLKSYHQILNEIVAEERLSRRSLGRYSELWTKCLGACKVGLPESAEWCKEMKTGKMMAILNFDSREKFRGQQIEDYHRMRDAHPDSIKYGAEFEKEWSPDFYFRHSDEYKAWVEGMKEVQRGGEVEAARFKEEVVKGLLEKMKQSKEELLKK